MSDDPLDTPPADHGSDRYDYIEVEGPDDPPPELLTDVENPCPDCRANVFIRKYDSPSEGKGWHVTVAHDSTCPSLATMEELSDE